MKTFGKDCILASGYWRPVALEQDPHARRRVLSCWLRSSEGIAAAAMTRITRDSEPPLAGAPVQVERHPHHPPRHVLLRRVQRSIALVAEFALDAQRRGNHAHRR